MLIYMISNCDEAGIWKVDKEAYYQSFGMKYSKEWILLGLGFWLKYLDEDRIIIPEFLQHRYAGQLKNINNTKYNPLNKLRACIDSHSLKFDAEKMQLIPRSTVESTVELATIAEKMTIDATQSKKVA